MKLFYYCVFLFLLSLSARAQVVSELKVSTPTVIINAKLIGKDSVIIPFNEKYTVTSDECAQVIRHGHYDFAKQIFNGKFTDVNKNDTTKIVAEGSYSKGLKNGLFILNYLNGGLMARGNFVFNKFDGDWVFYYINGAIKAKGAFKDNNYIGKWEYYYDNGKPWVYFDVEEGVCKIQNAWLADGTKTVNEGFGKYETDVHWVGAITHGLPDSTWMFSMQMGNGAGTSVVEYFKENKFIGGHAENQTISRDYNDGSHFSLLPQLPYFDIDRAHFLDVMPMCNGMNYPEIYIKIWGKTVLQRYMILQGNSVIPPQINN